MKSFIIHKIGSLRIITLLLGLAIFASIAINTAFYVQDLKTNYLLSVEQHANSLVQSLAQEILTKYILFGPLTERQLLIEAEYLEIKKIYEANKQEKISFISILSPEGVIITHTENQLWEKRIEDPDILSALQTQQRDILLIDSDYHTLVPVITKSATHLCTIDVGFPKIIVDEKVIAVIIRALLVGTVLFICIFIPVWFLLNRMLIAPIDQLITTTSDIAEGDLSREIKAGNTREFMNLSASLQHMRDSLRKNITDIEQKDEKIRALIACSPVALFSIDENQNVVIWTSSAERLLGWSSQEVLQKPLPAVPEDEKERFLTMCDEVLQGKVVKGLELKQLKKDGSLFDASLSCAPIKEGDGEIVGIMGALLDISDRIAKELEHQSVQEQLVQAQKMESIGRLAGGVAHDYNNMLSVILGFAELTYNTLAPGDPNAGNLQEIIRAAVKSADITKKLLAFARKETITPEVLDLNLQIDSTLKMLRRLIGEDIELQWKPDTDLGLILIDTVQVDQILANLCVNARDSMQDGGKISIETGNISIDDSYCWSHPTFAPGDFVFLRISDTGVGIDKDSLENIFEPFYTTKKAGEGTGLGLSTVYGIIKQNKGFINVYSELGNGTTFTIYLPRHDAGQTAEPTVEMRPRYESRGETILLVEDERSILEMVKDMLEIQGYEVLIAESSETAIEAAREQSAQIDLLLTDVILHDMNGKELSQQITQIHPETKVVFMSGYPADVITRRGILDEGTHFLQKPFSQNELMKKLRNALKKEKR